MLFISLIFCLHCAILGNDRKPCSSFHYSFCHVSNIVFTILLNMKIYHFFFAIAKVPNILIPLEMQTQHKGSFASSYVGCKFSEYLVSTISRQVLDHILRGYVFEHKGHFILEQAYQGDVEIELKFQEMQPRILTCECVSPHKPALEALQAAVSVNNGIVTFSRRNSNTQRMGCNALSYEEYAVKILVNKPAETSVSSCVSKL